MRIIHDLTNTQLRTPSYLTVGAFDGVHRGHQQLITDMVSAARSSGALAIAYTFDPHPSVVLGKSPLPLLTTVAERAKLLEALGLDYLAVPPFTVTTVRTSALDFVTMLRQRLGMIELWAGPDFGLGHQREGTIPFLRQLGEKLGFKVHVVKSLICGGTRVSSSGIRAALVEGDLARATDYLGRPYRLTGTIDPRQIQSSELADLLLHDVAIPPERLVPASGVYACAVQLTTSQSRTGVVYIEHKGDQIATPTAVSLLLPEVRTPIRRQTVSIDFIARLRDAPGYTSRQRLSVAVRDDVVWANRRLSEPQA